MTAHGGQTAAVRKLQSLLHREVLIDDTTLTRFKGFCRGR